MAELTPDQKRAIAEILAPELNTRHRKTFSLPPNSEALAKQHQCDMVLVAEDREVVRVEHTRAHVDDERYRGKRSRVWRVVELIRRQLKAQVLPGTLIALGFHHPPSGKQDQARVAGVLATFIDEKARSGKAVRVTFSPRGRPGQPLEPLRRWVSEVDIIPIPETQGLIYEAYRRSGFPKDEDQFWEAISRKKARYGGLAVDTVLVVEFDKEPAHYISVDVIRDEARQRKPPFREVWLVNNCQDEKRCWCVWP